MKAFMSRRGLVVLKEFLAELLGTGVLIMFGCGCVAQSVLSGGSAGGMLSINIGWGLGVLVGVLVAGPISGAHLNPAVSLSLACVGKFPFTSLLHYMAGQYLGAFLGSSLVLLTYKDALTHFSGGEYVVAGENATAGIFVTFPAEGVSNLGGAIDQVVGTALLLLSISAINTPANSKISTSLGPLLVALTVIAIGVCFGHNAGYAINPARDLGPRIMISLFGWGVEAFRSHGSWWWIPVVFCHVGGVLGVALHWVVVEHGWGTMADNVVEEVPSEDNDIHVNVEDLDYIKRETVT